jgi:hypothetical protein
MQEFCDMAPAALSAEADHRIADKLAMLANLIRLHASEVGQRKLPLNPAVPCEQVDDSSIGLETSDDVLAYQNASIPQRTVASDSR